MPLVTVQNLLNSPFCVPDPVSRVLGPKASVTLSLTYAQLENPLFSRAVASGVIAANVVADPSVPDQLEVQSQTSFTRAVRLEDDFLCDEYRGQGNWVATGLGIGAVVAAVTSGSTLTGAAGVVGIAAQANASAAVFRQSVVAVPLGFGSLSLEMRNRLSTTMPTVGENYTVRFGMGNQAVANAAPTSGVSLLMDMSISATHWVAERIFSGSTQHLTTTIPLQAGVWVNFGFDINDDGTACVIKTAGVPVWSIDLSAVVKNENTVRFGPFWQVIKTAGAAQRSYFVDYCSMSKVVARY